MIFKYFQNTSRRLWILHLREIQGEYKDKFKEKTAKDHTTEKFKELKRIQLLEFGANPKGHLIGRPALAHATHH